MRSLGFANKADSGEPPRESVEADTFSFSSASQHAAVFLIKACLTPGRAALADRQWATKCLRTGILELPPRPSGTRNSHRGSPTVSEPAGRVHWLGRQKHA